MNADAATAVTELTCVECLYDLRGRPLDGVCPECGTGVGESMRPERLDRADARWVRRVRWGVALAGGEYVAPLVTFAVLSVLPGMKSDLSGAVTVGSIGLCAGAGAWLMTEREPGRAVATIERVVRWAGVVAMAGILTFGLMATVWHPRVTPLTKSVPVTAAVASVVLAVAAPVVMRRLLRRMPGRPATWPTWASQAASATSWGIMGLGVGTDLLDNEVWVLTVALALCAVPPLAAGWVWWATREARRPDTGA